MYELTKIYKSKAMAINAIRMTATNKGWKVLSTEQAAEHVWPQAEGFAVNNTTLNIALGFAEGEVAQRVPAGSVTDGKALEAVNAALCGVTGNMVSDAVNIRADAWNDRIAVMPGDQVKTLFEQTGRRIPAIGNALSHMREALRQEHPDDLDNYAKAPKLQAPSKLEESKKENAKERSQRRQLEIHEKLNEAEPKAQTRCNVVNGARRPLRGKTLLVWETTEMLAAGPNGTPTLKEVYEELCRLEPGFNKTTAGIQYYACRAYNGWAKDAK